tara:strand:+ start:1106 stop:1585 length:480 start_codon:yes stop_codon:yes gene_type:complete
MALVTSSQPTIPDYEHEYHTIVVDTLGQASKNTFSVYLQQPLENIVQARLTAAQIHTSSSNVCHISIEELDTNFSQPTTADLNSSNRLNRAFGTLLCDGSGNFNFSDNYPVVQQYITPIRKLSRLSFNLRNQVGDTIPGTTDNYFILRFVCDKPNLSGR